MRSRAYSQGSIMFEKPTVADLREAAHKLGMKPSEAYLGAVEEIATPNANAYAVLDATADELPAVKYPRGGWYRPPAAENPHGAWYVKTSIKGKPDGKLAGRRIALKDNICLAGVPMMVGAQLLDGYDPEVDATVVERILDAGGEIAGKAVCEYFCVSGGSHTSSTGPVHNPRKRGYSAGGSSSGCAALVASGEVDMAIGGDQAGSIRIPASHCGIVGLKPTFGLVPYTGIGLLEITIDTCGPMTANVRDNALLLEMNGAGIGHEGLYVTSLVERAMGWRNRADEFADTLKIASIFSKYTLDRYGGRFYAKAQNLRRRVRAGYDAVLAVHDLLLLPTVPMKATPIPAKDATPQEITRRSWEPTRNTCPFNVTGHPAISLPCGMADGRPIGLMLVGRHYAEETIYRAAAAFERSGDWTRF